MASCPFGRGAYSHAALPLMLMHAQQSEDCLCLFQPPSKTANFSAYALQSLHDLKDPTGWTVARDDDLKVMYRHHAGRYAPLFMLCALNSNVHVR